MATTDKNEGGGTITDIFDNIDINEPGMEGIDTDRIDLSEEDKWKPVEPIEPDGPTVPIEPPTEEEPEDTPIKPPSGEIDWISVPLGQIKFTARGGEGYVVEIYKREWLGVTRDLIPAADTITTQENDSDDPLEPVRGSTGYVRFMYDGGLTAEGLPWWVDYLPTDATEMRVVLRVAGVGNIKGPIVWQGFVKPSQYSQNYDEASRVIALPIVSVLEVLNAVEMDAANVNNNINLRETIVEAVEKVGAKISRVMVPFEWGSKLLPSYINAPQPDFNWQAPMRAEASRFVWFDTTDAKNTDDPNWRMYEAETYGEALADFARFWGWTIREQGETLWLVSRRARTYMKVDWATMQTVGMGVDRSNPDNYTRREEITLTDGQLDGTGHTLDVTPAVRTVQVTADTNEIERQLMTITDNDYTFGKSEFIPKAMRIGQSTAKYYGYKTLYFDFTGEYLRMWQESHEFADGTENSKRAQWGKVDAFETATASSKRNWNYKDGIIATLAVKHRTDGVPDFDDLRIVELRSLKAYELDRGWLVINPTFENLHYYTNLGRIKMRLAVGDKYWNGTAWTDQESDFEVEMKSEDNNLWLWSTKDQKTLDMDCNGAAGYIVPVNVSLKGNISIAWLASQIIGPHEGPADQILVQNFGVEFYGNEGDEVRELESENRYYANTGATGTETKEIELNLATLNNNNPGYGLLKIDGKTADGATFMTINQEGELPHLARPEEVLLNVARGVYGSARKTLKMVVTMEDRERPIDTVKRPEWEAAFVPVAETIEWAENRRTVTLIG